MTNLFTTPARLRTSTTRVGRSLLQFKARAAGCSAPRTGIHTSAKRWAVGWCLVPALLASVAVHPALAASSIIQDCPTSQAALITDIGNAGAGGTLQFTCDDSITLSSTITIAASVTLDGHGHAVTLNGNHAVEVLQVNSGVTATLNDLTIANGSAPDGGGIANFGSLSVTNSNFSGNTAGDGGGIGNGGTLIVSDSTFSNNASSSSNGGAGIYNVGTLTVTRSTFSGNNAGGGTGAGGGIANADGGATVSNSTFVGNAAFYGGGVDSVNGAMSITNSTFSGNSGIGGDSVGVNGRVSLGNTVLADSALNNNCGGLPLITDLGGNVEDGASCGFTASTSRSILDPHLGPLANNGGPTQTMALPPGSPAIRAGIGSICLAAPVNGLDQRGFPRPASGPCDSGAYDTFGDAAHLTGIPAPGSTIPLTAVVGATTTATISLSDSGRQALIFTPAGLLGASLSLAPAGPLNVPSGATQTLTITCRPSATTSSSQTLSYTTNDPANPTVSYTVSCTGTPASTAVTLASGSPATTTFGQPVALSAAISAAPPATGSFDNGGTVTVYDGDPAAGAAIATCSALVPANGSVMCSTVTLAVGSHTLYARYSGDISFAGSTSAPLVHQVTAAPLTITANNQSMTYGGSVPAFTASYSGFVNGDTSSVVSGLGCGASDGQGRPVSTTTPAGSYAITCSGASAANYGIGYVAGTLTVTQASQSIAFAALLNHTVGDAPFTVSATGGASGNPVTFSAGPGSVCTAGGTNGTTITLAGPGVCTVTASQAGSANYQAASPVAQSFSVTGTPLTLALNVGSNPPGPVTTGSTVTAILTLGNHSASTQVVTVNFTLAYTGSHGTLHVTVPLQVTLNTGQILTKSASFTITKWFPRGTYTLNVTATDTSGDTATSSTSLTVS